MAGISYFSINLINAHFLLDRSWFQYWSSLSRYSWRTQRFSWVSLTFILSFFQGFGLWSLITSPLCSFSRITFSQFDFWFLRYEKLSRRVILHFVDVITETSVPSRLLFIGIVNRWKIDLSHGFYLHGGGHKLLFLGFPLYELEEDIFIPFGLFLDAKSECIKYPIPMLLIVCMSVYGTILCVQSFYLIDVRLIVLHELDQILKSFRLALS